MIGKLLVVDDEIWFREGLVQLIGGNQLGWEVVGEASDGEEALLAVAMHKPDLVITDINMPVMDGLQLMEELSRTNPDIKVIILTGYRDFEYAQRALRYGAVEFLLKPFSLDEAYRALRKAYEELRLKKRKVRVAEQERQTDLLRAAVSGLPCERTLREQWEEEWRDADFCLLRVFGYDLPDKRYTASDVNLLHYAVTNILQELLQRGETKGLFIPLSKESFAFLLEPAGGEEYREAVQDALQSFIGLKGIWRQLGTVVRFEDLSVLYGSVQIGPGEGNDSGPAAEDGTFPLKEELLALLVTSDLSAAERRLAEYVDGAAALELQPCKRNIYEMLTVLSGILMTEFKHLNAAAAGDGLNPARILEIQSVPELLAWARERCAGFLDIFSHWLNEQQDNVVVQAKQYIDTHYQQACSLQTVAAQVHVTPNYLSNLFKKETGIGFTQYISQLRIDRAKALLQGTRLRMTEIAERVGFDNSSYFTVVFKQITGESPRAYRRRFEDQAGQV